MCPQATEPSAATASRTGSSPVAARSIRSCTASSRACQTQTTATGPTTVPVRARTGRGLRRPGHGRDRGRARAFELGQGARHLARRGVSSNGDAMPWLAETDVGAAHGFSRALTDARTPAGLRRRALVGLARLVPADVMTWDRVELATGAVRHEAVPAEAEPPAAFASVVGDAAGHPLLAAHAARRRPALRLSDAVEPRRLFHSELFGDLL